jgi:hypothetical protein
METETIASPGADVPLPDGATTRAIAWLTAWDSQGVHRTATSGDEAGADWLIREATGLGATPEVEKFALDRLDPIDAFLEYEGVRIPGVPVFDAPPTGVDGVMGCPCSAGVGEAGRRESSDAGPSVQCRRHDPRRIAPEHRSWS